MFYFEDPGGTVVRTREGESSGHRRDSHQDTVGSHVLWAQVFVKRERKCKRKYLGDGKGLESD